MKILTLEMAIELMDNDTISTKRDERLIKPRLIDTRKNKLSSVK